MFFKKSDPNEFISSLEENLDKIYNSNINRDEQRNQTVIEHLNRAASLFKEIGMTKEAKQVKIVLKKFADDEDIDDYDDEIVESGIFARPDKVEIIKKIPLKELSHHLKALDEMIFEEKEELESNFELTDDVESLRAKGRELKAIDDRRKNVRELIFNKSGWTEQEYNQAKKQKTELKSII